MPPFVQFPNPCKIAEVTPILKDGGQESPNNYRSISLLPVLSKICERVAHCPLTSYLIANQRLSPKPWGNKKWNYTETSILQTTDTTLKAIEKKQLTAPVLLDMSKAFESVDHEIQASGYWFVKYSQSNCFVAISSRVTKLLKSTVLFQTNFL